jgi:RNA polymerase sigma-70 factor, ECF subfamily
VVKEVMNTQTSTDEQLIRRFSAGDDSAFDELFHRYRAVAYRVAYRLLGHESDSLDAVQEGFIKTLSSLDRFRGSSSFKTWLLRIVSNAALDLGRKRKRLENRSVYHPNDGIVEEYYAPYIPPERELEREDLRRRLDDALNKLSDDHRQTFVLHADGGMPYREVAETLGISIGTVMSRIFYARQRLRTLLDDCMTT